MFVLIGGTGDLAMRKILAALYAAHHDGTLKNVVALSQLLSRRSTRTLANAWPDESRRLSLIFDRCCTQRFGPCRCIPVRTG